MSLILSGTDGLSDVDGSAATPAIRGTDANTGIFFPAADTIAFSEGGVESMRIDSSGRVGIGTNSPAYKLDVRGGNARIAANASGASDGVLYFGNAATNYIFGGDGNNYMTFGVNNAERMRIDSSGNVGIGITTPIAKLQVAGGRTFLCANSELFSLGLQYNSSTGQYYLGATNSATPDLVFSNVGGAERMRLDTSGNLLVGGTTAAARMYVVGAGTTNATVALRVQDSATTDMFYVRNDGLILTGSKSASPYNNTTGSAANMFVDSVGSLYRSTSSLKYKKNVQNAAHGLNQLLTLRPVTYEGKAESDAGKTFGGLIAEEVHEAGLTEFVQYAEDGSPDALAYGNMVSLCVKAIQEQQAIITQLQADVEALQAPQGTP